MIGQLNKIYNIDCRDGLKQLPSESIDCIVTSPPYWALRDYGTMGQQWDADPHCKHKWLPSGLCSKCKGWKGQLGLEPTFELYIKHLCNIFDEVRRVLKKTGTCWINLGDTYYTKSGSGFLNDNLSSNTNVKAKGINKANRLRGQGLLPSKCISLVPFRFAIEMVNRGWILRNVIIWHKPNCMPSSVRDRFTVDFEYIFFFVKDKKYWFETQYEKWTDKKSADIERALFGHRRYEGKMNLDKEGSFALSESKVVGNPIQGRNKRCVWQIPTQPFREAHFATFPELLIETPIKAGCPEFICKKCGKARYKIFNVDYNWQTKGKTKGPKQKIGITATIPGHAIKKVRPIGYTNCGCNGGWRFGIVLDPFMGSGTTALVSKRLGRKFIGFEINPDYVKICNKRLNQVSNEKKVL